MSPEIMKLGYLRAHLHQDGKSRKVLIHRLVALAFGMDLQGKEINHIDGVKANNKPENLEAVTRSENIKHAFNIGLCAAMRGSKNPLAKHTEEQAIKVLNLRKVGMKRSDIIKTTGASVAFVKSVSSGRAWKHLQRRAE